MDDILKGMEVQDLRTIYPQRLSQTKSESEMTSGINQFAFDLYREVSGGEDVFISPFSMSLALSMLTTGAGGNTEAQLLKALGFEGKTTEELDTYYSKVMKNMASNDPKTTLSIANAIWADKNITLKEQFTSDCEKYFDSVAQSVDFSDPSTIKILNDWVSDNTGGKIDKMFEEMPSGVAAILANALYFKASWPFKFTRSGDRMLAKLLTTSFSSEKFKGVSIPYGNGAFSMRIILPEKGVSLNEVADDLCTGVLYNGNTNYAISEVSLNMPAFSFSYSECLNDALMNLGIVDAFGNADFSKMSNAPLCVGKVLHKTFVDVNEKGTEAASTTIIEMIYTSPGPGHVPTVPKQLDFNVNRDFIFQIVDASSGVTVFMGHHKVN